MGLSSTGSNPVSISNISFNIAATGSYQGNVSVTLYVSGIAVATKTITGSTLDFTGLNILVPQPQPPNSPVFNIPNGINIELVANFNSTFSTGTIQATLNNL